MCNKNMNLIISDFYDNLLQNTNCTMPCIEHNIGIGYPIKTARSSETNSSKFVLQFHPLVEKMVTINKYRQATYIHFTCKNVDFYFCCFRPQKHFFANIVTYISFKMYFFFPLYFLSLGIGI
jgi:hypothetical protein